MTEQKRIRARFFESSLGKLPVRDWLLSLPAEDRRIIGNDIAVAEFGWPIGMPICRSISARKGLWEIRSRVSGDRIARVFFCIQDGEMILLHGFIKKTQKTPERELETATRRMRGLI